MEPTVLVLGAGPAGIAISHKLLKHTVPKVTGLKIILVSPSDYLYWNIAAVRGMIPDEIPNEQLFHDLKPGFAKYGSDVFEFVIGKATSVDPDTNTVVVSTGPQTSDTRTIPYSHLVVATGSSPKYPVPLKTLNSYQETIDSLNKLRRDIAAANTIILGGAGPTGIEAASELGEKYGRSKSIILVTNAPTVLPDLLPSVIDAAESTLTKFGVQIERNARVTGFENGTVSFSSGKSIPADLYIPTAGVAVNTSFLPESMLDEHKNMKLTASLRSETVANIWGVGDVGNLEPKRLHYVESQVVLLSKNLDTVLVTGNADAVKSLTPSKMMLILMTMGKKTGTGQIGSFRAFGWLVGMFKSKTMMVGNAPGMAAGKTILMQSI